MGFVALVVHFDLRVEPEIQPVPALLGKLQRVLPAQDVILDPFPGGLDYAGRNGSGPEILDAVLKFELLVLETMVLIIVIDDHVADDLKLQVSFFHDGRVDFHVRQVGPHAAGQNDGNHGRQKQEIPYSGKRHVVST